MNLTQESRDLVSKHWGASNMAEKIEALASKYAQHCEDSRSAHGLKSTPPPETSSHASGEASGKPVGVSPIPDTDEAWARELHDAWWRTIHPERECDWSNTSEALRRGWRVEARRARELSAQSRSAPQARREDVIEECARVCDASAITMDQYGIGDDAKIRAQSSRSCAAKIRALASTVPPTPERSTARGVTPTFEEVDRVYDGAVDAAGHWTRDNGLRAVMALYSNDSASPKCSSAPTEFVEKAKALRDNPWHADWCREKSLTECSCGVNQKCAAFDAALASVDAQAPAPSSVGERRVREIVNDFVTRLRGDLFAVLTAKDQGHEACVAGIRERLTALDARVRAVEERTAKDLPDGAIAGYVHGVPLVVDRSMGPGLIGLTPTPSERDTMDFEDAIHGLGIAATKAALATPPEPKDEKCAGTRCGYCKALIPAGHVYGIEKDQRIKCAACCGDDLPKPAAVEGREAKDWVPHINELDHVAARALASNGYDVASGPASAKPLHRVVIDAVLPLILARCAAKLPASSASEGVPSGNFALAARKVRHYAQHDDECTVHGGAACDCRLDKVLKEFDLAYKAQRAKDGGA